jgi:hypothetical protein
MKKFYIMLLALILALAMIVPMTIPVAAAPPTDTKKPVAWVNGSDCSNNDYKTPSPEIPYTLKMASAISVKYLSDDTTVGKVVTKAFSNDLGLHEIVHSTAFDQDETYWWRNGDSKYFQFVYIQPNGNKFRVTMADNGEGKNSDPDTNYWEVNVAPPGDPEIWAPMFLPFPMPIPNGNNQIHLPDYDKPIPSP